MTLPPALTETALKAVTGIRAFNELPIDAAIWEEAHAYHSAHRRLHLLGSHRHGILAGLEVTLSASVENRIIVAPGLAIDRQGNTLLLAEPVSLQMEEAGLLYIVITFQPLADRNSGVAVGGGNQYYRVIESRDVRATRDLPKTPYLELARIYRAKADDPARRAANPFDPGTGELNLLHRSAAFPACIADGAFGELTYVPKRDRTGAKPNRAGLLHLQRTARQSGMQLDFAGPVNVQKNDRRDVLLLYLAGDQPFAPLGDEAVDGLRNLLGEGAVLVGEAVGGGEGAGEWGASFAELTARLGAKMKPLSDYAPLLTAHDVFGAPPPGAAPNGELTGDSELGVLFSTCDWGGAWQGRGGGKPLERERIRAAHEWGVNLLMWSAQRRAEVVLGRL